MKAFCVVKENFSFSLNGILNGIFVSAIVCMSYNVILNSVCFWNTNRTEYNVLLCLSVVCCCDLSLLLENVGFFFFFLFVFISEYVESIEEIGLTFCLKQQSKNGNGYINFNANEGMAAKNKMATTEIERKKKKKEHVETMERKRA